MSEMLILNPSKRPRKRRSSKRASPAQKRARAAFAKRARARRRNPAPAVAAVKANIRRRRRNPLSAARSTRRRRRNPIGSSAKLGVKSILSMFKDAAIGGAGAVGVDVAWGKINGYLPVSMQVSATKIGAGDAVKAVATVVAGKVLSKVTRGLSQKMAMGALTTQARDLISTMLPASVAVAGLGYANPAAVVRGTNRVGPIRSITGNTGSRLNAYVAPGQTALLNAYTRPGVTQLLSRAGGMSAREREGYSR